MYFEINIFANAAHLQMVFIYFFKFFIYSMRRYSLSTKWSSKLGEMKLSPKVLKGSCKCASYFKNKDIIILNNVSNFQAE